MEKRHDEFAVLVDKATALLLDETPPLTTGAACELLICVQPTFSNWTAWTLCSVGENAELVVRRTVWDKLFDQRRFFDPLQGLKFGWHTIPTTQVQIGSLSRSVWNELFALGKMLKIEPNFQGGIVIDGERRVLKWQMMFGDRLLSWSHGTTNAEEFTMWTRQIIAVFERVLPAANA